VHLGQRHVEDDRVGPVVLEERDALLARVSLRDLEALPAQRLFVERRQVFLVFYHQHPLSRHRLPIPPCKVRRLAL
jgi:hypothetical protein